MALDSSIGLHSTATAFTGQLYRYTFASYVGIHLTVSSGYVRLFYRDRFDCFNGIHATVSPDFSESFVMCRQVQLPSCLMLIASMFILYSSRTVFAVERFQNSSLITLELKANLLRKIHSLKNISGIVREIWSCFVISGKCQGNRKS